MSNVVNFTRAARSNFIERFTFYMMMSESNRVIPGFVSIFEYARHTAAIYWDENHIDRLSPEECAEADMSFWPADFPIKQRR
jgi:hypothetical protein